jgi:hypothetical protein
MQWYTFNELLIAVTIIVGSLLIVDSDFGTLLAFIGGLVLQALANAHE